METEYSSQKGVKVFSTGRIMPSLVIILSVLWATCGVVFVILGVTYAIVFQSLANNPLLGLLLSDMSSLYLRIVIPLIVGGILYFFVGRGLWKGQIWARIAAIVLLLLGAGFTIWGFVKSLIENPALFSTSLGAISITATLLSLAINLTLAGYFIFNQGVKDAFAKQ